MDFHNTCGHKRGMYGLRLVFKACKARRGGNSRTYNRLLQCHKLRGYRSPFRGTCSRRGSKDIHHSRSRYTLRLFSRSGLRTDILFHKPLAQADNIRLLHTGSIIITLFITYTLITVMKRGDELEDPARGTGGHARQIHYRK